MSITRLFTRPIQLPRDVSPPQSLLVSYLSQPRRFEALQSLANPPWYQPTGQNPVVSSGLFPLDPRANRATVKDAGAIRVNALTAFEMVRDRLGGGFGFGSLGAKQVLVPEEARAANKEVAVVKATLPVLLGWASGLFAAFEIGLPAGVAVAAALVGSALIYRWLNGKRFFLRALERFTTRSPDYVTNPWATYLSGHKRRPVSFQTGSIVVHRTGSPVMSMVSLAGAVLEHIQRTDKKSRKPNWQELPVAKAVQRSVLEALLEGREQFPTDPVERYLLVEEYLLPLQRVAQAMQSGALHAFSENLPKDRSIMDGKQVVTAADLGLAVLAVAEWELGQDVFRRVLKGDYSFLINHLP